MELHKRRGFSILGLYVWCLFCCSLLLFSHFTISMSSLLLHFHLNPTSAMPRGTLKMMSEQNSRLELDSLSLSGSQIRCARTFIRYDLCTIDGPTVMVPTAFTFYAVGFRNSVLTRPYSVEKIKPYPRKFEPFIMAQIKELTIITSGPRSPVCQIQHSAPALVFSAGGYTGNFFHDFNDGFIPLFITVNSIFPEQEFVIVVSEAPDWWINKYIDLLSVLTSHPILTLNDTTTHCFPSATFGLISHGFMTINQTLMPNSKTFLHFRALLDKAFSQNVNFNFDLQIPKFRAQPRPRLLLANRNMSYGRAILNRDKVIEMIKEIGFDVLIFEPNSNTSLHECYALINSSHAMVGVHGAALTHSVFLRPGAVFVQVVPIGVEWASDAFFGRVGRGLNLEYIEYKIGVGESSLAEKYGNESTLLKDPQGLQNNKGGGGWPSQIMDIYLKEQNVKIDLERFRTCLKKAYKKAKQFMQKEG